MSKFKGVEEQPKSPASSQVQREKAQRAEKQDAAALGGNLEGQAAGLQQMPTVQRQALLGDIGRVQGNQHVQRLLSALQRDALQEQDVGGEVNAQQAALIQAATNGGSPLPEATRALFEQQFGYDLSEVRVHTGEEATQAAQAIGARAFTQGKDIVFAEGSYAPGTSQGDALLAHELTHVVQQRAVSPLGAMKAESAQVTKAPGNQLHRWAADEQQQFGAQLTDSAREHRNIFNVFMRYGQDKTRWKRSLLNTPSDDIIIELFKNRNGKLDIEKVPENLTVDQTVLLCRALISKACLCDEEHAVILVLLRQRPEIFHKAIEKLTMRYIKQGLKKFKGETWPAFAALSAGRYEAGKNVAAETIIKERDAEAARILVTGIESMKVPAPMDHLSGPEWVGVLEVLLNGPCKDQDKDALVAVVDYLVRRGQGRLIDMRIGQARMERIEGRQWKQVRDLMNRAGFNWD